MDREDLKIAVDITKTKLTFFGALAGAVWLQVSSDVTLVNGIIVIIFVGSVVGVIKNLLLLGKYEERLKND